MLLFADARMMLEDISYLTLKLRGTLVISHISDFMDKAKFSMASWVFVLLVFRGVPIYLFLLNWREVAFYFTVP